MISIRPGDSKVPFLCSGCDFGEEGPNRLDRKTSNRNEVDEAFSGDGAHDHRIRNR